jgi:hypothetical protein
MRARRSRPQVARRFGGMAILAAVALAAVLVAVFMVNRLFSPQDSGLAEPSTSTAISAAPGGTGPAPASTVAQRSHPKSGSGSARHARNSASPSASPDSQSASPARSSGNPAPTPTSASPTPAPSSPSPAPSSPSAPRDHATNGWLMTKSLLSKMNTLDSASARWFFNAPSAFVKGSVLPAFAATPMASYTSYAQFAQDLADGSFPAGVKWVMYGLESTTDSPLVEKQNPAVYLKHFAQLAHQHGLQVIEVPGQDLMGVPGAACRSQPGEPFAQAYVRCRIPAAAHYADAYLIEAQGLQTDISKYAGLVTAAASQVRAVAPHIRVMSGLTTDRADSAAQIFNCWMATRKHVSGYWMNSTAATLPVAAQALDLIRAEAAG